GSIDIVTTRHLEQTYGAQMDASGVTQGGSVRATSGGSAWLSGQFMAAGEAGIGGPGAGTAGALGVAGAPFAGGGGPGGGRVRVGGGWQGGDADLANARTTTVTAASLLSANAGHGGQGGTVVVWSEQGTGVAGQVQARGGATQGDGGQVELSSRGQLAL